MPETPKKRVSACLEPAIKKAVIEELTTPELRAVIGEIRECRKARNKTNGAATRELTDAEVDALLCEYSVKLNEVDAAAAGGDLGKSGALLQEIRESSGCSVCQEIIDEVVEANQVAAKCSGPCEKERTELRKSIGWAKGVLCPTASGPPSA